MPRYNITAEFTLSTEIEVELGYHAFSDEGVAEEFSDESYFSTQSVEADGGNLRFVIEAPSEEQATEKAVEIITEGVECEDSNGLTWLVENVSFEVEEIEEPMTMERAEAILIGLAEGQSDPAVKEAVEFVFDRLTAMDARLSEATQRIDGLVERVRLAETTETVGV